MPYDKFSVGVLFENSIVCHVFYAMALGAARDGLLFVVCGFWGCFVLVCLALCCGGWVGPGLVFWTVVLTLGSGWLCLWLVGACFCWFCLESLILAQDERWRRA